MRVLGVCDVKMHLHRDLASSVKLLIFEHLAADLIIGRKQCIRLPVHFKVSFIGFDRLFWVSIDG